MENYEKLIEVIQQANPEIMELKFGCQIGNSKNIPLMYVGKSNGQHALALKKNREDAMLLVDNLNAPILGRPIRLADVLLAIAEKDKRLLLTRVEPITILKGGYKATNMEYLIFVLLNLKDDNLDHQSDETKQFLIDLLVR